MAMNDYKITQKQLNKLENALLLAQYFIDGGELDDQNKSDQDQLHEAFWIIEQVERQAL